MELDFSCLPDAAGELEALLERSGVDHVRDGGRFVFVLSASGRRWQTVCDCSGPRALIYAVHPAMGADEGKLLRRCSELNRRLERGCFFLTEGHAVYRTGEELRDFLDAQDVLAEAVERSASAMVWAWDEFCP